MLDSKPSWQSMTLWGALLMVLPVILGLLGIGINGDSTIAQWLHMLTNSGAQLIGFILVVWGRLTATKVVRFL